MGDISKRSLVGLLLKLNRNSSNASLTHYGHSFIYNADNAKYLAPIIILCISIFVIIFGYWSFSLVRKYSKVSEESKSTDANGLDKQNIKKSASSKSVRYGTCDDKISIYSNKEVNEKNNDGKKKEAKNNKLKLKHPNWLIKLTTSCYSGFSNKNSGELQLPKKNDSFSDNVKLRQFSFDSLNSFQIDSSSNENLSAKISKKPIIKKSDSLSNTIVNYSLYLNESNRSVILNLISIDNVLINENLNLTSSNSDLNIYVKIELITPISEDSRKLTAKTHSIKNRKNPVYNETFEFSNLHDLFDYLKNSQASGSSTEKTLSFSKYKILFYICNLNVFGRDQLVGQTFHNFFKDDLVEGEKFYSKKINILNARPSDDLNIGQIHMSLVYNNSTRILKFHLIKANDLKIPNSNSYLNTKKRMNTFVKIYLLYDNQRIEKKQTKVLENTNDPEFDEIFEFDLNNLMQMVHHSNQQDSDMYNFSSENENKILTSQKPILKRNLTETDEVNIASKIRIFLLIMDYDKVEKSDTIGRIELRSKYEYEKKTFNSDNDNTIQMDEGNNKNWYKIFNKPNLPIYCSFQINSLN